MTCAPMDASAGSRPPIRVAIVEDVPDIRAGLAFLINGTPGYCCIATCGAMEEALTAIPHTRPDIVLVDLGLPGMSGIEGIRVLKARDADLKLVALTIHDDDDRILHALCAGACGYLLKKTPPARLLECLGEVMHGGAAMSPEIASRVIAIFKDLRPAEHADYRLTPHETRLLKLLADGHSYKSAAEALASSVHTVAFHMKSIYAKLQVHSKSEAVAKALRTGLFR